MINKVLAVMLSLAVAGAVIAAAETAEQLTLNKCGSCHGVDKFCKHLGKKDAASWTKTVDAMIKKGAKINDQEKKTIAEYLAGLKAGAKPICK
jgi:mono/diheme cytochrome c family protein